MISALFLWCVSLEGQQQHVEHQRDVVGVIHGHAGRRIHVRVLHAHLGGALDSLLDLTHAGEVLVQFLPVAAVEARVHGLGVLEHVIEDGMMLGLATLEIRDALVRRTVSEQALEDELRIVLGRERLIVRAPGHVVLVGAGISGIAFAGLAHRIAAQLE
jgi:hypothetical protein